jgi:hypothetical protein
MWIDQEAEKSLVDWRELVGEMLVKFLFEEQSKEQVHGE